MKRRLLAPTSAGMLRHLQPFQPAPLSLRRERSSPSSSTHPRTPGDTNGTHSCLHPPEDPLATRMERIRASTPGLDSEATDFAITDRASSREPEPALSAHAMQTLPPSVEPDCLEARCRAGEDCPWSALSVVAMQTPPPSEELECREAGRRAGEERPQSAPSAHAMRTPPPSEEPVCREANCRVGENRSPFVGSGAVLPAATMATAPPTASSPMERCSTAGG